MGGSNVHLPYGLFVLLIRMRNRVDLVAETADMVNIFSVYVNR